MKFFLMLGYQCIKLSLDVIYLKQIEVVSALVLFILFLQTYLKLLAYLLFWESNARQQVLKVPLQSLFSILIILLCVK